MEVEAKAAGAGGRAAAACVGCCVFLCFCVVVESGILATNDTYFAES